MNIRTLLAISAAILGLTSQAVAQSMPTEATVAKVTGTVTAQLPDGSTVKVEAGTKLPQGATITTGDKSDAYLVSHGDTTSVITQNSVVAIAELSTAGSGSAVTKQTTTLDLKSGNLVAKLNPAKKSVNNYSVRTPKGVAAARGTVFTVSYNGGTYALTVVNGTVTIVPTSSGAGVLGTNVGVQVNAGESTVSLAADPDITRALPTGRVNNSQDGMAVDMRELLAVAVATVAIAAQNNIGGTTAAEAAAVAAAVFAVVPGAAEQAGAIIKQSTPAGQDNSAVLNAITEAAPESAKAAFTSGSETGTFTPNTNTTTTSQPNTPPAQVTTPQPITPETISKSN
jgi:hypothetical protein